MDEDEDDDDRHDDENASEESSLATDIGIRVIAALLLGIPSC
jgi:hypothetical protein